MAEQKQKRKNLQPRTNAPPPAITGGNPARPSNAGLMRGMSAPDRYSAGFPAPLQMKVNAALALINADLRKEAATIERELGPERPIPWSRTAGEEREPEPDRHTSSPDQAMRPRAEIILFDRSGVWCRDHGDYLLFPGGGVDDGEQPRDAAIRETIEESNHHPINVEPHGVVEAVWPKGQNDFWDTSDFDGERTYFFLGLDAGPAGITHDDLEDFEHHAFSEVEDRLRELVDRQDQAWAKRNNQERLRLVQRARRLCSTLDGCRPRKQASDSGHPALRWIEKVSVSYEPACPHCDRLFPERGRLLYDNQTELWKCGACDGQFQWSEQPGSDPRILDRLKQAADCLPGGLADDRPDSAFPEKELEAGVRHELEHTSDRSLAREIAKDHLAESDDYYSDLRRMEEQDEAEEAMEKASAAGPQHPATGGQTAPSGPPAAQQSPPQPGAMPQGIQPVSQHPQSPVTGMQKDRNAEFIHQLSQRIAPQQQQAAMQPTAQTGEPPEQGGTQQAGMGAAGGEKVADAASFLRRRQRLMITPDGQVIVRRLPGRRFALPEGPGGVDAPYERPVRYIPPEGVPEEGVHGYEYALGLDEADEVPEGFEGLRPEDVLKDLYASMGKPENQPWRDVDRQRARALIRLMKRRAVA